MDEKIDQIVKTMQTLSDFKVLENNLTNRLLHTTKEARFLIKHELQMELDSLVKELKENF